MELTKEDWERTLINTNIKIVELKMCLMISETTAKLAREEIKRFKNTPR